MAADDNLERVESLRAIASRQVILTAPLEAAIAKHGEEHLVVSVTKVTPFGNYLLGWREVEAESSPAAAALAEPERPAPKFAVGDAVRNVKQRAVDAGHRGTIVEVRWFAGHAGHPASWGYRGSWSPSFYAPTELMADAPAPHVCSADCWAYLLRAGVDENSSSCDPFAARAAADREAAR